MPNRIISDRGTAFTTILNTLAAAGSPEDKWDLHVKNIQNTINVTVNNTGMSSLEEVAGYKGRAMAESKLLSMVQQNFVRVKLQASRSKWLNVSLMNKRNKKNVLTAKGLRRKYILQVKLLWYKKQIIQPLVLAKNYRPSTKGLLK